MALSSYFNELFGNPASYPRAASDENIRALLHGTAYESGTFKHQFPPRFPILGRTYFGRLPTAPADFPWPRAPGGTPFTFMAQVDCSELPEFKLRKFLPGSGVLHFFVNWEVFEGLEEAQSWPNHVVFSHGTAESWREAHQPADLPPCYGASSAGYHFRWLKHTLGTRAYPRAFAKKAMTMGVVRNFAEEYPSELDSKSAVRYQEIQEEEQTAELVRFYGDPVTTDALPEPKDAFPKRTVQRPSTTFPAGWIDIEIFLRPFSRAPAGNGHQANRARQGCLRPSMACRPCDCPGGIRGSHDRGRGVDRAVAQCRTHEPCAGGRPKGLLELARRDECCFRRPMR